MTLVSVPHAWGKECYEHNGGSKGQATHGTTGNSRIKIYIKRCESERKVTGTTG